ncbi:very long chain fatty acid elongase AAEL008004 isoform X3 [Halyomorpha halys]|uniref:very long chain fatty acid elongase AAEL008004 isoform X3 n=1 Tax=Halyomorpha halys TaxID=286706 RepID=UPI000D0C865D|nr:elongation of very long chain fatty acids protein AAEL008004-like isoform X2 [Halyomorpha halys]
MFKSMTFNSSNTSVDREMSIRLETTAAIIAAYLIFCKYLGPWFMKNREPFSLRIPMLLYNVGQTIMNGYMLYMVFSVGYIFGLNKLIDFTDTVFFILRKKTEQATPAHIYHHALTFGMIVLMEHLHFFEEVCVKMICLNVTVHVILHLYYLLTVISPSSYQKFRYLKQYMTMILILELVLELTILMRYWVRCQYTTGFIALLLCEFCILLYLFSDNYRTTYMKKPKEQ